MSDKQIDQTVFNQLQEVMSFLYELFKANEYIPKSKYTKQLEKFDPIVNQIKTIKESGLLDDPVAGDVDRP